ncbi:actin-like protein [Tubulinosema ratisbonensis]|uniref:Actin-like protein n=1 Tax=Tubulinosema ratisbonensis TaxID=291195 RepID=A0A437AJ92_9MICR|nr:actin-like protein [Tubulinosema ratisbonensis]
MKLGTETVVIDNGTSELRAGYENKLLLKIPNKYYKLKDKISFGPLIGSAEKTMFDNEVITNFENFENILDHTFKQIELKDPVNLIITEKFFTPDYSRIKVLESVFELYNFKKFQFGNDAIYSFYKNKVLTPCLIFSFSNSMTSFINISDKIRNVTNLNFGGKQSKKYIQEMLNTRYSIKKITDDMVNEVLFNLKVCENYEKETVELYFKMKEEGIEDFTPSFLQSNSEIKEEPKKEVKRTFPPKKVPPKKKESSDLGESEDLEEETLIESEENISVDDEFYEEESEYNESLGSDLEEESTEKITNDSTKEDSTKEDLTKEDSTKEESVKEESEIKKEDSEDSKKEEKISKKEIIAHFSSIYRHKQKILKELHRLSQNINKLEANYEIKTNLPNYLSKLKERLKEIKYTFKQRDNILRELKNKRSLLSLLRNKDLENIQNEEEMELYDKICWAENSDNFTDLKKEFEALFLDIKKFEPEFEWYERKSYEILSGLAIERRKIPEILFSPSIININGIGVSEILGLFSNNKIFITGGFSQIQGLENRIREEALSYALNGNLTVIKAEDPIYDSFNGATFLDILPTFSKEEYLECGSEYLVKNIEF